MRYKNHNVVLMYRKQYERVNERFTGSWFRPMEIIGMCKQRSKAIMRTDEKFKLYWWVCCAQNKCIIHARYQSPCSSKLFPYIYYMVILNQSRSVDDETRRINCPQNIVHDELYISFYFVIIVRPRIRTTILQFPLDHSAFKPRVSPSRWVLISCSLWTSEQRRA